jgi:hypothetical protein
MADASLSVSKGPPRARGLLVARDRGAIGWVAITAMLLVASCSAPAVRVDRMAAQLGFDREVRRGVGFDHVVYLNHDRGPVLHLYLEGDGSPWDAPTRVARDPTPRNPLMLELMAQDENAAAYVGRPCYHGYFAASGCGPAWWTDRRYSPEVVESMGAVIRGLLADGGYRGTVLIGHSGGGTLAMLLAEHLRPCAVVTLAGNLDVAAWCARHRFTPLSGSLDPGRRAPLPPSVRQLHLVGKDDGVILPAMVEAAAERQPNARVLVLPGVDHRDGWKTVWPSVLSLIPAEP